MPETWVGPCHSCGEKRRLVRIRPHSIAVCSGCVGSFAYEFGLIELDGAGQFEAAYEREHGVPARLAQAHSRYAVLVGSSAALNDAEKKERLALRDLFRALDMDPGWEPHGGWGEQKPGTGVW